MHILSEKKYLLYEYEKLKFTPSKNQTHRSRDVIFTLHVLR